MACAYPETVPAALAVCAAVTAHRHEDANQAVNRVAVNPVDITLALRATQKREGRVMEQPPAHAQHNRQQRTQHQHAADGIRKSDLRERSADLIAQVANTTQSHNRCPSEPRGERSPDIQPLED